MLMIFYSLNMQERIQTHLPFRKGWLDSYRYIIIYSLLFISLLLVIQFVTSRCNDSLHWYNINVQHKDRNLLTYISLFGIVFLFVTTGSKDGKEGKFHPM